VKNMQNSQEKKMPKEYICT